MGTIVFVHGACVRDAAWWWSAMRGPLRARGIDTAAVALPSCGETGEELGDLAADVEATRAAVAAAAPPVALCGHSYGGVVITEAGAHPRVEHLLYLASVMPDAGESMASMAGADAAPWLDPGDDGTVGVHPDVVRELFLQDCDEATTAAALSRLTRQSAAPFAQAPRAIAWRETPSTYLVCTDDLAIPPERQRARIRGAARVVDVPTGHHPFLADPNRFAATLADAVGWAGASTGR